MADIIDLNFYRKFKIILPLKRREGLRNRSSTDSRVPVKRYRRRQKLTPNSEAKKKD